MLQTNRKPGETLQEPVGPAMVVPAQTGHAVLVSALARESAVYSIIQQACVTVNLACHALEDARRSRLPNNERSCLIIALLPQGERRVPPDVSEAVELSFPGVPILLLCQEQLVRPSIAVEDGRVILIGQPFTEEKIGAHLRSIVENLPPLPPVASASGPRPGISRARNEAVRKPLPKPARPASKSGSGLILASTFLIGALAIAGLYLFMSPSNSRRDAAEVVPVTDRADRKKKNETAVPDKTIAAPPATTEKSAAPEVVVVQKEPLVERPPAVLTLDAGAGENIELRLVSAGAFTMGSASSELGRDDDETIPHEEKIERPFYLATRETTQSQFAAVMGVNPSQTKDPRRPVDTVSFLDAAEFCEKLAKKTSRSVRLPSEKEWEYACRATTSSPFSFGETLSVEQANIDWPDVGGERRREGVAAGSFAPNTWGFYDMHGNVREWCRSNADSNAAQVLKGGSWATTARQARSAARHTYQAGGRNSDFGFRIAVNVPAQNTSATSGKPVETKTDK